MILLRKNIFMLSEVLSRSIPLRSPSPSASNSITTQFVWWVVSTVFLLSSLFTIISSNILVLFSMDRIHVVLIYTYNHHWSVVNSIHPELINLVGWKPLRSLSSDNLSLPFYTCCESFLSDHHENLYKNMRSITSNFYLHSFRCTSESFGIYTCFPGLHSAHSSCLRRHQRKTL